MTQIRPAAQSAVSRTTLARTAPRAAVVSAVVGAIAMAVAFALGLGRGDQLNYFLHAYLTSYVYYLSISLGALFFVAMLHAFRAGWGVTARRLFEILAANMTGLAVLFVPVLLAVVLGNRGLYEWTDPARVHHDQVLREKTAYLNVPFFVLRAAVYFGVWWFVAQFYLRCSRRQDESGDPELTLRMERFSGPALLLLAGTVTFAAFDWLMSLDPAWYSTIYGVYFFSGAMVGGLAAVILAAALLQSIGRLVDQITVEHYHDLGKLLLAFVIFWGYIAFSQYMLIWYGNIPEETAWYRVRQTGPWAVVSLALLFGHLIVPFFGLLSREVKRRKWLLGFWAVWLLVAHWVDIYWLVMPRVDTEQLPLGLIDLCLAAGLGCLWLAGVLRVAGACSLVPLKDPRLAEALTFKNV